MSQKGLGKGLSALISETSFNEIDQAYLPKLQVNLISPNPYQPRVAMNPDALKELADSIKEHGVIEPLIVTKNKDTQKYDLIAGERRLEAAKLAGLETVPAVLKEASPQQMLELAVVENIQRSDLNPLEEGMAFEQLVKEFNLSHTEISEKVGFSRSAVANKIRLLNLPEIIKEGLLKGDIDEGHARALLGLTDQSAMIEAFNKIIRDKMSVRAVEELVRRLNQGKKLPVKSTERIIDEKTLEIESKLKNLYTNNLKLNRSKKGGKIIIPFKSDSEFEEIYKKLLD